jgi:glycosyltransferase involved in cell wall biosynthesis
MLSFFCWQKSSRVRLLMTSHRYSQSRLKNGLIKKHLTYIQDNAIELFDGPDTADEGIQKSRAIVLKNPIFSSNNECIERGIFLITFTGTLQYYIKNIDVPELQKYFHIVLEPSWAGYCLSEILWWSKLKSPVFVQATEKLDFAFLKYISPNLLPLTFGASDWVDHRTFFPLAPKEDKIYDFLYVSNHKRGKRNFSFLKALAAIKSENFKAAIVCSGWGSDRDYNFALRDMLELEGKVDILENLKQNELNVIINRSKVNILLSLKEGSNRSIFESMFADTPCIVLENNIGVNKTYVNSETGLLISEANLPDTLLWFKEHYASFNARAWAMKNISIFRTKEKLDDAIKNYATSIKEPFSIGSSLKINASEAKYFERPAAGAILDAQKIIDLFSLNVKMKLDPKKALLKSLEDALMTITR